MPNFVCCVTGCGRKYSVKNKESKPSFFGIPTVLDSLPDVTKARRSEWLKRLNMKENEVDSETKVCDAHFESGMIVKCCCFVLLVLLIYYINLGKPSYILMHEDVDWAPNKQLCSVGEKIVNRLKRHVTISSKRMAQPIDKSSKKKRNQSM